MHNYDTRSYDCSGCCKFCIERNDCQNACHGCVPEGTVEASFKNESEEHEKK